MGVQLETRLEPPPCRRGDTRSLYKELPFGQRIGGDDLVEQGPAHAAAADGDNAHDLVVRDSPEFATLS